MMLTLCSIPLLVQFADFIDAINGDGDFATADFARQLAGATPLRFQQPNIKP